MIPVPTWIKDIADRTLQDVFIDLWQRLPEAARAALVVDCPLVLVSDIDTNAKTRVGVNRGTGRSALVMLFRPEVLSWPREAQRGLAAHELAHIYLRHFDHLLSTAHRDPPAEVVAYQEWHVTFLARYLWDFAGDVAAWRDHAAR